MPRSNELDGMLSALNAVLGDYLHARGNALEVAMGLRHRGEPLACERGEIARAHPDATGRVCVLLHGLADTERVWRFASTRAPTYGSLLRRDLGFTPFYVRYNTGLRVAENGAALAALLEGLAEQHPIRVRELVLVGHSMGGLVIRSACEAGARERHGWLARTTRAVYIGSPHLGAPLEKLGHVVGRALRAAGNPYAKLVADVADLRSAGIRDLRHGDLGPAHARRREGAPRTALAPVVPLRPGIAHYAVAGTIAGERHLLSQLLGDALVRVPSAAGRSADEARALRFPPEHVRIFPGVRHRQLAHDRAVYRQLRAWCAEARP